MLNRPSWTSPSEQIPDKVNEIEAKPKIDLCKCAIFRRFTEEFIKSFGTQFERFPTMWNRVRFVSNGSCSFNPINVVSSSEQP